MQTDNVNDENHFEELLEEYESFRPRRGQIVQGEVLALTKDTVLLDVGAKRDAVVPHRELGNLDETIFEDISIGDQIPVYVTNTSNYDNELQVSIEKGLEQQDWERAKTYLDDEKLLELKVIDYNKGGLLVEFGRLNGFVPNSRISALPRGMNKSDQQTAKAKMIGTTLQVKVIDVDSSKKRLILSGRASRDIRFKQLLQEIEEGQHVTGTVTNIVDFGVFVDLGGVDGLIHISRLSWNIVEHPSDCLKPGDEVEVLIQEIDQERGRISLDRKSLLPSPWDTFVDEYNEGDFLEGTVESLQDYGAFVKLTDGITGLIHTSELLSEYVGDPEMFLDAGKKVLVRIIEINKQQEHVKLSMRRVPEDEIAHWIKESDENHN